MANYDCLSPFIRSSFDAYDIYTCSSENAILSTAIKDTFNIWFFYSVLMRAELGKLR